MKTDQGSRWTWSLFVCCVGSEEGNKGKKRAISQFTSPRQPQLEEEETGRNSYLNG
jgi:hypothetical protein